MPQVLGGGFKRDHLVLYKLRDNRKLKIIIKLCFRDLCLVECLLLVFSIKIKFN